MITWKNKFKKQFLGLMVWRDSWNRFKITFWYLWLPHEMGRYYVFMLILEFIYLSEIFHISGRVTMSTLRIRGCPSVCRQIKRTSTQKVISRFWIFIHIWIKQDVEKKFMKRKFWIWKKYRWKTKIHKMSFNSKTY